MWKNPLLFFLVFIALSSFNSFRCFSSPLSEETKRKNVLVIMVNEVAQTYFQATESLTNEIPDFDSSRVKLLLTGMHQTTEILVSLTEEKEWKARFFRGNPSFHEIRQLTLLNLNNARQNLSNERSKTSTVDFTNFVTALGDARVFCEQLLGVNGFREPIPASKKWTAAVEKSASEKYEESMGADNVITSQWLEIMEWGGGRTATEELRLMGRKNQAVLVELKKKDRALVKTGAVEQVRVHTDTVDGVVYKYADFPPEKWSFIYTPDRDLVKGLVSWLVYINSGNSVKFSDVASMGMDGASYDSNLSQILEKGENRRIITTIHGDQILLKLSAEISKVLYFEEASLKKVIIENNRIVYYSTYGNSGESSNEILQPLFILENIQGDLLDKIKREIDNLRLYPGAYNPSDLGLSRF